MSTDLKLLWREWRSGQLRLIVGSLIMAITVVTSVGLVADRIEQGLRQQISSFLGADLALQGSLKIPDAAYQKAQKLQLVQSNQALFRSMVFVGERSNLAEVKVVDQQYPLRGDLKVTAKFDQTKAEKIKGGPEQGEVWIDSRLLNLLNVTLGEKLELGYSKFVISRVIVNEPDRGSGYALTSARVMINQNDLAATGLAGKGSRVNYYLLLAGDQQDIQSYEFWFKQQQQIDANHFKLRTPQGAESRLSEALQRGRTFLLLSGTIGILLAGLAMALASYRHAQRLQSQTALMKAWGVSAATVRRSYIVRLLVITFFATVIGMVLGWLMHMALLAVAKGLFQAQLPPPTIQPWLLAAMTGLVVTIGFAVPAFWHLPAINPLAVLRKDIKQSYLGNSTRVLIGLLTLVALSYWYSSSVMMTAVFIGGLLLLVLICSLIALVFIRGFNSFGNWRGSFIRLGLANLWRQRTLTLLQLVGFSITLMLLLVTIGIRGSLIKDWQAQLPDNAPTHFIFNVASSELSQVKTILAENQVNADQWYPMTRGRLVSVNGNTITPEQFAKARGLSREVNFTEADQIPQSNTLVEGQWWTAETDHSQQTQFSMEQNVAEQLGAKIGDTIEFSVGGIRFDATLTSIREVDWESMQANFYVIFNPGALTKFSPNWLSSVVAKQPQNKQQSVIEQQAEFVPKLLKDSPTVAVIPLGNVIDQIRLMISRVTQGLELILVLLLTCGAMVLLATTTLSLKEKTKESAVLRAIGCSRKLILGAVTVEFLVMGIIAGIIAAAGAEVILSLIKAEVFAMPVSLHPWLWFGGIFAGAVLITVLGLFQNQSIFKVTPMQSLKEA